MRTEDWAAAAGVADAVDRRERRAIGTVVAVVLVLAGLAIGAWLLGFFTPSLRLGSAEMHADEAKKTVTVGFAVENRGALEERLIGVDAEAPGLTVADGGTQPVVLGRGEAGQIVVTWDVECSKIQPATSYAADIVSERWWGSARTPLPVDLGMIIDDGVSMVCPGK